MPRAGSKPPRTPCVCCWPSTGRSPPIAQKLDAHNRARQKIERGIADEVISALCTRFNAQTDFVIVEGQLSWHIGVVGIVAARVLQQFYRPTIILGAMASTSAGPAAALPVSIWPPRCANATTCWSATAATPWQRESPATFKLDAFRARLNDLARDALKPDDLQAPVRLDAEVTLEAMTLECLAALDRLRPTGLGNPPVQVFARNLTQQRSSQRMALTSNTSRCG